MLRAHERELGRPEGLQNRHDRIRRRRPRPAVATTTPNWGRCPTFDALCFVSGGVGRTQGGSCLDGPTIRQRRPEHRNPSGFRRARHRAGWRHAGPSRRPGSRRLAAGLGGPGPLPRVRAGRGRDRGARQPGVDPDRPLAGRRHPLRRRDGVTPSCADRLRGGRRTRARRPLAQRHPGQRPARGVEPARGRRRDRRSAVTRCTSWTPRRPQLPPSRPQSRD